MTNVAVDKEKAEKRRALGRGLESLLPGPRVVAAVKSPISPANNAGEMGHPASISGPATSAHPVSARDAETRVGQTEEQVPPVRLANGRNDNALNNAARGLDHAGWEGPYQDDAAGPIEISAAAGTAAPPNLVLNLAIEDIDKNPFQTRHIADDDALQELANSIQATGVVQPIVVRPAQEEGRYILILGQRRIHASKKAGKTHIPAIVRRVSAQQAAEMTIVENLQRDDLSPLEHAESFKILATDFKLTQAQIGERVGLSRESVANYMRLLRLPREVMQLLAEKKLNFAKAKELLKLSNPDDMQQAALYAVKHGLSMEQVENLVLRAELEGKYFLGAKTEDDGERKSSGSRWVDPNVRAAQFDLERLLGVKVRIRDRKGKGRIVIEYSSVDDYDRVVGMLKGK
jgi:ParB family chromosome partitioning protein